MNIFKVLCGNRTRLNISVLLQHRAVFTKNRINPHKKQHGHNWLAQKVFDVVLRCVFVKLV